jgi:hypothetical protein
LCDRLLLFLLFAQVPALSDVYPHRRVSCVLLPEVAAVPDLHADRWVRGLLLPEAGPLPLPAAASQALLSEAVLPETLPIVGG